MAQTAHGVPYPLPDEPVAEGAARIRDVAEYVDAHVLAELKAAGELRAYDGAPEQVRLGGLAGYPAIYFGTLGDTELYRSGPGQLRTAGSIVAAKDVNADRLIANADIYAGGGLVYFGAANDTNLYRPAAGSLMTDGNFTAGATLTAAWNSSLALQLTGAAGGITFGGDTNVYRAGAATLQTDAAFKAVNYVQAAAGRTSEVLIGYDLLGNGNPVIRFGAGDVARLYAPAQGTLKTDGILHAVGTIAAKVGLAAQVAAGDMGPGGAPGVLFGNAGDTSLYRSAANQLRTPGQLVTGADVFVADGTSQRVALGNRYLGWPAIEFGNQTGIIYIDNGSLAYRGSNGTVTILAPP